MNTASIYIHIWGVYSFLISSFYYLWWNIFKFWFRLLNVPQIDIACCAHTSVDYDDNITITILEQFYGEYMWKFRSRQYCQFVCTLCWNTSPSFYWLFCNCFVLFKGQRSKICIDKPGHFIWIIWQLEVFINVVTRILLWTIIDYKK